MKEIFEKALPLFFECDFKGFIETINPLMKYFMTNQMIILVVVSLVALKDDEVLEQFISMSSGVDDEAVQHFINVLSTPIEVTQPEEGDGRFPLYCLARGTRFMRQGDLDFAKPYLALCAEGEGFESDIASTLILHIERTQGNGSS